jgi:hypothetical protein
MTMDSPTETRSATVSICELAGCSGLELVALAEHPLPTDGGNTPVLRAPSGGKVGLLATPEPRFSI